MQYGCRRPAVWKRSWSPAAAAATKNKVIVISGPTGAGKTRLALDLAKRLSGEIISADSVQVYRGLDVGSAKPSSSDRAAVPHHLIDILHASDDYSAGDFFHDARAATDHLLARARVPIVAGGTGLYLRWYIYGKPSVPQSSMDVTSAVWSELSRFRDTGRWEEAVDLVANAGDPKARDLSVNNWSRLRRSLEIISLTNQADQPTELELDYDFLCIFLACPRVELYRSIDLRCEEMLADTGGLLSEASWLLDIGLSPGMNSATCAIGYRNFSKRQMTWFRNEKIYQWVDASQPFDAIAQFICDAYHDRAARLVPDSLEMKRESCRHESRDLKTYRSENRVFRGDDDCCHVLDWITRTQRK
ncbi:hypothetical protein DAI22_06g292400 [Oryza sativa Japonica Group]|nr:hypothetical protein DAI22_06g292400 [Oryza sativa Japonica Group]